MEARASGLLALILPDSGLLAARQHGSAGAQRPACDAHRGLNPSVPSWRRAAYLLTEAWLPPQVSCCGRSASALARACWAGETPVRVPIARSRVHRGLRWAQQGHGPLRASRRRHALPRQVFAAALGNTTDRGQHPYARRKGAASALLRARARCSRRQQKQSVIPAWEAAIVIMHTHYIRAFTHMKAKQWICRVALLASARPRGTISATADVEGLPTLPTSTKKG